MTVAAEKARKKMQIAMSSQQLWQSITNQLTENITLKHFQFRSNLRQENETFITFCNNKALEAKHCNFNSKSPQCTAEETAVRDQIIIGLKDNDICQEALKRSWHLE